MSEIITLVTPQLDAEDMILKELRDMMAAGHDIDAFEFIIGADVDASMKKVRDFLISARFCDKAEWAKATKQVAVKRELGFIPRTAVELVDKWIETNKISVNFQRIMKRTTRVEIDGIAVSDEARKDRMVDAFARINENRDINTASLARDLRAKTSELGLRFSAQDIADAVSIWFDDALAARVSEGYGAVAFGGEGPNSERHTAAWNAVVSQFDASEHSAEFVIAVLKKFIWQVKRKMLGLRIDNHLMPVILGPQGVGKSTFVREFLLAPIDEFVGNTNFKEIEDGRNMEQWLNFALFLDEMGYAAKADIDTVKNRITSVTVSGRPMGTNANVQYRQNATFIGCSNKELDQLIRDETGNRRFVALRYSSKPDWSKTANVDPVALWTSVDEYGEDPSKGIAAELRAAQEVVREKSQVEQWLADYVMPTAKHGKKQKSKDLYPDFKEWVEQFGGSRVPEISAFGKEMNRLINYGQIKDWSLGRLNGYTVYSYK